MISIFKGIKRDLFSTAQNLRVSPITVQKLRRLLDPELSFEEHRRIFPLDLGPVWDLDGLASTKSEPLYDRSGGPYPEAEWLSISHQFSTILQYGLGISTPHHSLTFQQIHVDVGCAQRLNHFHADNNGTGSSFKKNWQPPKQVILMARDKEPNTLFISGLDKHPGTGDKEKDDAAIRLEAKTCGRFVTRPAGHVIATTDRSLHAGQPVLMSGIYTFARDAVPIPR